MSTNPEKPSEIDVEVAFGEAFGASLLLGTLLKTLVHKGLFSDPEVAHLIDQTLLAAERLQGDPRVPARAMERARGMLESTLLPFSERRRKP